MGRHDFTDPGRPADDQTVVDLADVVSDDVLLDVIGAHRAPTPADAPPEPTDVFVHAWPRARTAEAISARLPSDLGDPLSELFVTWREQLTAQPLPAPPSAESVAAGVATAARARRTGRPVIGIAAAICALLIGSAAVGARAAHPGDMLFPVTQVLWSDRADSMVAGKTAREALTNARSAIDAGMTEKAKSDLRVASTVIPKVKPRDGKEELETDLVSLWAALDSVGGPAEPAIGVAAQAPEPSDVFDPSAVASSAVSSPSSRAESSTSTSTSTSISTSRSPSRSAGSTSTSPPSGSPAPVSTPAQVPPPDGGPSSPSLQPPASSQHPTTPTGSTPAPSSTPPVTTTPSPTAGSSTAPSSDTPTSTDPGTSTSSEIPASSTAPSTPPASSEAAAIAPTGQQSVGGQMPESQDGSTQPGP